MIPKVILFTLLFSFFRLEIFAQSSVGHFVERVIEVRNFTNAKHVPVLSQLLTANAENSHVVLTCEEQGWIVLKIDLNEIEGDEQLSFLLKSSGLEFIIKEGATKKDVMAACKGELRKF